MIFSLPQAPGSRGRRKKESQPKTTTGEGDDEAPGKPYECQRECFIIPVIMMVMIIDKTSVHIS